MALKMDDEKHVQRNMSKANEYRKKVLIKKLCTL